MTFSTKTLLFYLAILFAGSLFAIGLQISLMVEPSKVQGFLDISGAWDPSLALVLFAAVSVFSIGFALLIKPRIAQNNAPILSDKFHLPTAKAIDKSLILGAVMFGAGWGIAGLCPGPSIVNLVHLDAKILVFFIMMLLGMKIAGTLKLSSIKS